MELPTLWIVCGLGFVLGIAFGATAQRTNFCTMGAISDMVFMGEWNRMRAWMLAIAVAIAGSQAMHLAGLVDLNKSIFLTPNLGWSGAVIGGLLFGFGMTMTGGCGNKTLVRLGAGNLKSLLVALVMGIFAYMTVRGLIGLARIELEGATNIDLATKGLKAQGLPDFLVAATGMGAEAARGTIAAIVVVALLVFCFKSEEFRESKRDMLGGIILGALIPAAWYVTGVVGRDEFEPTPLSSISFVNPVGESIQYLMTFTGATINFGIAVVGGVIVGSFIAAKSAGEFRIEAFTDGGDMLRHIIGAAIMGVGGILALGCTIGQGLSGMSTLALGSVIALVSIITGGVYGMKYLEEGSFGDALKAMFQRG
jgi:uncharacterized membrane protein YedE/YeeE